MRGHLAGGAARATDTLREAHGSEANIAVGRLGLCLLADFPHGAVSCDDDLCAGVGVRFEGPLGGSALFAMDPAAALHWVRALGDAPDPIAAYLESGHRIVTDAVGALWQGLGTSSDFGPPRLEEDSVPGLLLATHAPSDTALLSAEIAVSVGDWGAPATLFVLLDPKILGGVLGAQDED